MWNWTYAESVGEDKMISGIKGEAPVPDTYDIPSVQAPNYDFERYEYENARF